MSFALTGRIGAREALALARPHVLAAAALAAVVFAWLFAGRAGWVAGAFAAFDWLLAGLFNRIADVPEDRRNGVPGVEFVARNAGALMRIAFLALALSLLGARPLGTPLLVLRCLFHAGGFAYSFPTVTRRLKEMFLIKDAFPGLLFTASAIGYPLALGATTPPWAEIAFLGAFLLPLASTYGLVYDLRDAAGDAAEGLVTAPVKWGARRTRALIDLLLALSAAALLSGYLLGALRWSEVLMIAAPVQQALVLRLWIPRQVRSRDAVGITWLGAAQLASFLAWALAGLPMGRPW